MASMTPMMIMEMSMGEFHAYVMPPPERGIYWRLAGLVFKMGVATYQNQYYTSKIQYYTSKVHLLHFFLSVARSILQWQEEEND